MRALNCSRRIKSHSMLLKAMLAKTFDNRDKIKAMKKLSEEDEKRWNAAIFSGEPETIQRIFDRFPEVEVNWAEVFFSMAITYSGSALQYPKEMKLVVEFYDRFRAHIDFNEIFGDIMDDDNDERFLLNIDIIGSFVVNARVSGVAQRIAIRTAQLKHFLRDDYFSSLFFELREVFPKEMSQEFLVELESGVTL